MNQREAQAQESIQRILKAATLLFAEHGYHGVSTRALAAAVELNIATINHHMGSKEALYQAVLREAFAAEEAIVRAFVQQAEGIALHDAERFRDLLFGFVEQLLAFNAESPEIPRLWMRRWLESDAALVTLEDESAYSQPLFTLIADLLRRAHDAGSIDISNLDLDLFMRGFSWMLFGYFVGGPPRWKRNQPPPTTPAQLEKFRLFLCDYLTRMLGLPPHKPSD